MGEYIEQLIENVFVTKVHVAFQAVKLREEQLEEIRRRRKVEDEQAVVDADGQAEHDAEHRGDRGHLDDAREGERAGDTDPDPDTLHPRHKPAGAL